MKNKAMNLERAATGAGGLFYGVYPARVVARAHDAHPGQVQVALPMFAGKPGLDGVWARVAVPLAGDGRGTYFIPEVDDEVLVAFEAGRLERPYVVGALWNGVDAPPVDDDEAGDVTVLRSRSGMQLKFDDSDGTGRVSIDTASGAAIAIDESGPTIEIDDGNGSRVTLSQAGVKIETPAALTVSCATLNMSASLVNVDAGMAKFSGVVQCDTLISTNVVASSYTPGAGNIW